MHIHNPPVGNLHRGALVGITFLFQWYLEWRHYVISPAHMQVHVVIKTIGVRVIVYFSC